MPIFLYRLLLTFNATSLLIAVYFVKTQETLHTFFQRFPNISRFYSYVFYFLIPVVSTLLSLYLAKFLGSDSLEKTTGSPAVIAVEQANNAYLPSYLGYFFVALSVPYCDTLIYVFAILFLFTYLSQTLYFNPLFLIFGYKFYYLTTPSNVKIFVITKKNLRNPDNANFPVLKRINDFTFIDRK
jgi:hypothetical protein